MHVVPQVPPKASKRRGPRSILEGSETQTTALARGFPDRLLLCGPLSGAATEQGCACEQRGSCSEALSGLSDSTLGIASLARRTVGAHVGQMRQGAAAVVGR